MLFVKYSYLYKVNDRSTGKRCEICSKLTIKHQNEVNDVVLVFLLLTLNTFHTFCNASIVDCEQVNNDRETSLLLLKIDFKVGLSRCRSSFAE